MAQKYYFTPQQLVFQTSAGSAAEAAAAVGAALASSIPQSSSSSSFAPSNAGISPASSAAPPSFQPIARSAPIESNYNSPPPQAASSASSLSSSVPLSQDFPPRPAEALRGATLSDVPSLDSLLSHDGASVAASITNLYEKRVTEARGFLENLALARTQHARSHHTLTTLKSELQSVRTKIEADLQLRFEALQQQLAKLLRDSVTALHQSENRIAAPLDEALTQCDSRMRDIARISETIQLKFQVEPKTRFIQNFHLLDSEVSRVVSSKPVGAPPINLFELRGDLPLDYTELVHIPREATAIAARSSHATSKRKEKENKDSKERRARRKSRSKSRSRSRSRSRSEGRRDEKKDRHQQRSSRREKEAMDEENGSERAEIESVVSSSAASSSAASAVPVHHRSRKSSVSSIATTATSSAVSSGYRMDEKDQIILELTKSYKELETLYNIARGQPSPHSSSSNSRRHHRYQSASAAPVSSLSAPSGAIQQVADELESQVKRAKENVNKQLDRLEDNLQKAAKEKKQKEREHRDFQKRLAEAKSKPAASLLRQAAAGSGGESLDTLEFAKQLLREEKERERSSSRRRSSSAGAKASSSNSRSKSSSRRDRDRGDDEERPSRGSSASDQQAVQDRILSLLRS